MTATIRWTSGPMHLEDQGNGDSCWVLLSDYSKLQDITIAAQKDLIDLMNVYFRALVSPPPAHDEGQS